jgi:predicted dinucleotide-binding enzyme
MAIEPSLESQSAQERGDRAPQGGWPAVASVSEIIARWVPSARVANALDTLPVETMFAQRPTGDLRRVVFVAGDDADGIGVVQELINDIHVRPAALGSLAESGKLMQLGGPLSGLKRFSRNVEE